MELPACLRDWLFDEGSLTRRLHRRSAGALEVKVIAQRAGRPSVGEARALGIDPARRCVVRRVYLHGRGEPWVYARTVIPHASLTGSARRLKSLGSKPLGAALFADPSMERGGVEAVRVRRGDAMHAEIAAALAHPPEDIWGRRSIFRLSGRPLLVSEFFLPGLVSGIS